MEITTITKYGARAVTVEVNMGAEITLRISNAGAEDSYVSCLSIPLLERALAMAQAAPEGRLKLRTGTLETEIRVAGGLISFFNTMPDVDGHTYRRSAEGFAAWQIEAALVVAREEKRIAEALFGEPITIEQPIAMSPARVKCVLSPHKPMKAVHLDHVLHAHYADARLLAGEAGTVYELSPFQGGALEFGHLDARVLDALLAQDVIIAWHFVAPRYQ